MITECNIYLIYKFCNDRYRITAVKMIWCFVYFPLRLAFHGPGVISIFKWWCSFHFFPSQYRHRNCCRQCHLRNKRRSKDVSGFGFISLQVYLGLSLVSFESWFWKPSWEDRCQPVLILFDMPGQLQGIPVPLDMPVQQLQGVLAILGTSGLLSGCIWTLS